MGASKKDSGDNSIRNVIILALGFNLLMACFLPMAAIAKNVLKSAEGEDPSFTADGYISLAFNSISYAIATLLSPLIVRSLGVRATIVLASTTYSVFAASYLYPNKWLVYGAGCLMGFAAGNIWVANGKYFTKCSTKETIGRNTGIYWPIFAMGQVLGNAFVFWRFQGKAHLDWETRTIVISTLTALGVASTITFCFLGMPNINQVDDKAQKKKKAAKSFSATLLAPFSRLREREMLLFIPTSIYHGIQFTFYLTIYPASVGFSLAFGDDSRKLSGLSGIIVGLGSVLFGVAFASFGKKLVKNRRHLVMTFGFVGHCIFSALVYLNLPDLATLGPTYETSWFNPPSIWIVMICSFLLGIGDGCVQPQIVASIGVIWPDNPSPSLAIFRFIQAVTSAVIFYVSTMVGLHKQLILFIGLGLTGLITFWINEKGIEKRDQAKSETTPKQVTSACA